MDSQEIKDIFHNGLWKQNTGIVQLLGLCPLLAVSSTVVNGVSLGLATTLVMTLSSSFVAPIRTIIPNEVRIETAWRYIQAYQLITGSEFTYAPRTPEAEEQKVLSLLR